MELLPTQILNFNIYRENTNKRNILIGAGDELTLPDIVNKTFSMELPSGTVDLPSMRTDNLEQEIPFNMIDVDALEVLKLTGVGTLIIRGSYQKLITTSHSLTEGGLKVTEKGFFKSLGFGKMKKSDKMDGKTVLTLTYLKIEDQDIKTPLLEIDKLNNIYKLNGKDMLKNVNKYL